MTRMVRWGILVWCVALPLMAEAKEHGGREHGGTTVSESRPSGLRKQEKASKGLQKQDKTPAGWTQGKKKGRKKSTTAKPRKAR